jgi:hypothetical protein
VHTAVDPHDDHPTADGRLDVTRLAVIRLDVVGHRLDAEVRLPDVAGHRPVAEVRLLDGVGLHPDAAGRLLAGVGRHRDAEDLPDEAVRHLGGPDRFLLDGNNHRDGKRHHRDEEHWDDWACRIG